MEKIESHRLLTDKEFDEQIQNCILNPSVFTHEAHLRLAWLHVRQYGIDKAIGNIRKQLQNFVAHHGVTDKYNDTVTVASVKAVYHFMLRSKT